MTSIKLSERHGVNPTIPICFFCGEEKEELILLGRLPKDQAAPRNLVYDYTPCDYCSKYLKEGIMLIEVDTTKTTDKNNPYRTGSMVVIKEDALKRAISDETLLNQMIEKRLAFVPKEDWKVLGLDRTIQQK